MSKTHHACAEVAFAGTLSFTFDVPEGMPKEEALQVLSDILRGCWTVPTPYGAVTVGGDCTTESFEMIEWDGACDPGAHTYEDGECEYCGAKEEG